MHPILTLNLYDIKIPNEVKLFSNFLNGAKDLAREHRELFEKESIPISIFHNEEIAYSGVQFSRHLGAASFTAVGAKEVQALELWFELFQQKTDVPLENFQIIRETYTPHISDKLFHYSVTNILLKKEIAEELRKLKSIYAKEDRLQKYLYGNIRRFIEGHLGFVINKDDYITVKIIKAVKLGLKDTYHGGKLIAYNIKFKTNIYLPHSFRLGQAIALGYGMVKHG